MKFSLTLSIPLLAYLLGFAVAAPAPVPQRNSNGGASTVAELQGAFDRNNPNGTPTNPGNEDDLNGDGVINLFEAGAQAAR